MDNQLEPSYPSSHILIVFCILSTAMMQLPFLIQNKKMCRVIRVILAGIIAITIVGRLISGVHWFTDIMGGLLIGSTLVMAYASALKYVLCRKMKNFPLPQDEEW